MKNIFDIDGGLMSGLSRIADLALLNLLFVISCLPIFTIGAATTGLYYVTLKWARKEDGYIFKGFMKAFRENFKKSTIIWLGQLVVVAVLLVDFYILKQIKGTFVLGMYVIITILLFMVIFTATYVYPLLAHFENTIKNTVKNAFLLSIANLPRTILMVICSIVLVVISCWNLLLWPLLILGAFSFSAYVNAKILNRIFLRLEPETESVAGEDEGIFKDSDLIEQTSR